MLRELPPQAQQIVRGVEALARARARGATMPPVSPAPATPAPRPWPIQDPELRDLILESLRLRFRREHEKREALVREVEETCGADAVGRALYRAYAVAAGPWDQEAAVWRRAFREALEAELRRILTAHTGQTT